MCSICGVFRPDGAPVDADRVVTMRTVMAARGPDGDGLASGPGHALGHGRLAIIDLSEAGRQPMANEDGTVVVVFNGEIYNFDELRPQLEAKGHRFASRTDTEVLIHGYEEWGIEGLLGRIRGMFAFGLLDLGRHELHLARDPLGKKPLFFRHAEGELAFASSARALARGLPSSPEVDPTAVLGLLWHLYIPGPGTIFEGVEKLPPGHALTLGRDGRRREFAHWRPDFSVPEEGVDEREWLDRVEDALARAVKRRLIADVPIGVLLSGGVDSGLVTAMAARAVGRVKTYSVEHEDPSIDESRYARAIAARYDTEHHPLLVTNDVRADLPALVAAMGEPLADTSAANVFSIAKVARRSVTVVLTGDGADECFGGYTHMLGYHVADQLRKAVPRAALPAVSRAARVLLRARGPAHRVGTLFRLAGDPLETSFGQLGRMMDDATRASLFTPGFLAAVAPHPPAGNYDRALAAAPRGSMTDRTMQAQLQTLLPDDYLAKVDLGTMAAGLEARSPFLDLDLVELAGRIPARIRFRRWEPKGLLRRLARRHVPAFCVDRRKQGFVAPVARWMRDWSDVVDDLVLGPHVEDRGWFRREGLKRLVDEHRAGADHAYLLWGLVVLEQWLRLTLD